MDGSPNYAQLTSRGLAAIEDRRFDEGQSVQFRVEKDGRNLPDQTYGRIGSFIGGFFGGFRSAVTWAALRLVSPCRSTGLARMDRSSASSEPSRRNAR